MALLPHLHLRSIELTPWPERLDGRFPFNVPLMRGLGKIEFLAPVSILVGENGTGKSTLIEVLACASGVVSIGTDQVQRDPTLKNIRELAQYVRLVWTKRTRKGFFLRAEDFFGYARRMASVRQELEVDLRAAEEESKGRSLLAQEMATMPYKTELGDMRRRYGEGLDNQSHGESFLLFFQQRFVPGGLYLLDEPEAPLSPVRQMALLAMLHSMVSEQAQFIISTHSPILMAYPGAAIYNLDDAMVRQVAYDDLEHVRLTREFLNDPGLFLRQLGLTDE